MKNYVSLIDALADLKKRGYEADFGTTSDCLYCSDIDIRLNPAEFNVDEVYRFEGDSNPDDNTVVYAITSFTGVKGVLVDENGGKAEPINSNITPKIHTHNTIFL